jgi:hypothetical protein
VRPQAEPRGGVFLLPRDNRTAEALPLRPSHRRGRGNPKGQRGIPYPLSLSLSPRTLPLPDPEVSLPALALWTPEDGLLGALAPLGLAIAAGTALVVDLDPLGPHYPGTTSLADLVADGPRKAELSPARQGVAVLRNGGVAPAAAAEVVSALVDGWERVVLRLPPRPAPVLGGVRVVPVRLLVPGGLFPYDGGPAVYQTTRALMRLPGPGLRLPRPRTGTVAAFLEGRRPAAGDRWIRAWRPVWEAPWGR